MLKSPGLNAPYDDNSAQELLKKRANTSLKVLKWLLVLLISFGGAFIAGFVVYTVARDYQLQSFEGQVGDR